MNNTLIIYLGGTGGVLLNKYSGTLDSLYIGDDKIIKRKNILEYKLIDNYTNYLDGYYMLELDRFKDNKEELSKIISKYNNILIVAGLGGNKGTAGLIFFSQLCNELKKNCSAIVSTPFHFEGKRRSRYALEALSESSLNFLYILDNNEWYEKLFAKRVKEGTVSVQFEISNNLFVELINYYEKCIKADKKLNTNDFKKIFSESLKKII